MPPRKKKKATATGGEADAAAAASPSPSPSPSPADPRQLTVAGIDQLRALSQHRPHRFQLGGVQLAGAAAPIPPPPAPITLQVIQINRYFVDQRFWSLIGVPFPQLPSDQPLLQQRPLVEPKEDERMDLAMENGNGNGAPATAAASASNVAVAATNAPPGFDAYSDLHVAYDLLLSDGRHQLKVVLSPTLAIHIEKGGVLQFAIIQVTEAGVRYDETVVSGAGIYVVKGMNIVAEQTSDLVLADATTPLTFPAWAAKSDAIHKPLIGGPRSYYLSLYNDDTIYFTEENYPTPDDAGAIAAPQQEEPLEIGRRAAQPMQIDEESKEEPVEEKKKRGRKPIPRLPLYAPDVHADESRVLTKADTVSIRTLLTEGSSKQYGDKSLVCRIFAKSRILNFGRKSTLTRQDQLRAPFSLELLVGDESEEQIKVVLWNTLVGAYFDRVHIGQIVAISGFRLKQARSDAQYELVLNPYNPTGRLRLLTRMDQVDQSVGEGMPAVTMTISSVAVVRTMADDSFFDVAGVVTFASPMTREWSPAKKQFYQFRWLLLVDQSCTDALAVKVYTNSQQLQLEAVRVADVLYLSNLTLRSTNATTGANPAVRSIVATSTNYTQLLDHQGQVRTDHPYLLALHQWSGEVDHGELALYPSLFNWSFDFEHYKSIFSDAITPMREVAAIQAALRFQQTRSLLLQGFVAELLIHPAGLTSISAGTMTHEAYDEAMQRMFPPGETIEPAAPVSTPAAAPAASPASAAPPAVAVAPPSAGKKRAGRPSKAEQAAERAATAAAAAASPDLSQTSTLSSRLRRSTRANTLASEHDRQQQQVSLSQPTAKRGRSKGRATAEISASQPTASTSQMRSRTRSASLRVTKRGRRSASAEAATTAKATRKGGKVAKIVKKRKASRSATPAAKEATTPAPVAAAAAPAAASPVPTAPAAAAAVGVTSVLPAPAPAPVSTVSLVHPSHPSVLATLLLRDLNGETTVRVELADPVLGHVNYAGTKGNIADKCQTPQEAPRIFLGLSHILPASSFTPSEWQSLMVSASSGAVKGKKKLSPLQKLHADIRQLQETIQAALTPRRLLATVAMTRTAYQQVEARITTVFQADN